jgi:hypothetical protein
MNLKTNLERVFDAGNKCAMGEITTEEFDEICIEEEF